MSEDVHKKAERLMAASRVEGISETDRAWLNTHLAECTRCSARAEGLEKTLAALRSMPVTLSPSVVEAARRRVRARALELQEQQSRRRGLWTACALSWLFGVISAPPLWYAFRWLGQRFDLPQALWVMGLAIYWVVPAAIGAAALAWQRSRNGVEDERARISLRN